MECKILIVDDDPVITKGLDILLKNAGYITKVSQKGNDVMVQAKHFKPHLIVLDVMLGEHDGREIAKKLKLSKETRTIPVVLISANQYMKQDFESSGAKAFISKPFESNHLLRVIKKYCP